MQIALRAASTLEQIPDGEQREHTQPDKIAQAIDDNCIAKITNFHFSVPL